MNSDMIVEGELVPVAARLPGSAGSRPTVERLAAAFLLSHQGNTREAYQRDLAHFAAWCARHEVDMLAVTRAHLDAYTEQQRRDGAAPATISRRLSALSGFYAYAVEEGVLARNPAARVRRPKVGDNVQSTGLSKEEAVILLDAAEAHSPRTAVVVQLLLLLGLRVSELCRARVEDLGYERGHRVLTVTRKGGRRQRMVIPPRAIDALERYLAGRDSGPLVATATGRPMDRHAVWRLLRRLARDCLPHLADRLHPHDLRHACATLALDAGAELRDVQDLLGHADPRTTRRYDRARHNLDRSPTYAVAGLLAGRR
ncbi:Integrase family protein [Carbonactinospora thermoautotrophica]|uniref:Integrase family protein n=2 Tax=Carbonactinospora thermoautotrophica TaxID=1469144 RepID=A0A132MTW3_9ACTN|nr:tyrosine-type recombinase/integrase [Carbonactinospora thermoautotrophica]KWX01335.1 Integrase family protein [Carbonactinospora thermoautotrophica]